MISVTNFDADPLAGYLSDKEMAERRKMSQRTLRLERQRGDGPPFAKVGNQIYYPLDDFRVWLKSRVRHPARGRGAAA